MEGTEETLFDFNEIIDTYGDEELAGMTLSNYEKLTFQEGSVMFTNLVKNYRNKNYDDLSMAAHSLKGGARGIYANSFIEICNNLQVSAKERNETAIRESYIKVLEHSQKIHVAVLKKLAELFPDDEYFKTAKPWEPTGEVLELMEEFKHDLEHGVAPQEVVEKEELAFSFETAVEFFGDEDSAKSMLKKTLSGDLSEAKLLEIGEAIKNKNATGVERAIGGLRRQAGFIGAKKLTEAIADLLGAVRDNDFEQAKELFTQTIKAAMDLYNGITKIIFPGDSSKEFILGSKLMEIMNSFSKDENQGGKSVESKQDPHEEEKQAPEEEKKQENNGEEEKEIQKAIDFNSAVETFGDEDMVIMKLNKFVNEILTSAYFENIVKAYQQEDVKTLQKLTFPLKTDAKSLGMEELCRTANELRQNLNVSNASEIDEDAFRESFKQLLHLAVPTSKAAKRILNKPNLPVFQITDALSGFVETKKDSQLDNIPQVPDYDESGTARFNYDTALENFHEEHQAIRQVMDFTTNHLAGSLLEQWADLIANKKYSELKKEASNLKRDALKLGMEAFGNICKQMNMAALEESEEAILEQFQLLVEENPKTFYKVVRQLEIKGVNFIEPSEKVKELLKKRSQPTDAQQGMQNGADGAQQPVQKFTVDPKRGFVYGRVKGGDSPPPTGMLDFSKIYLKKGAKENAKARELKEKALQEALAKEREAQAKLEAEKAGKPEEPKIEVSQTSGTNASQDNPAQQNAEEKKEGFKVDPKKGFQYGKLRNDSPPPTGVIDFSKIYEKKGSKENEKSRALKQKALLQALEREGQAQKAQEKPIEQPKINIFAAAQKTPEDSNSRGSSALGNSKVDSGAQSPNNRDGRSREEVKESRFKSGNNEDNQVSYTNQQRNILKRELGNVKTDRKGGPDSATADPKRKKTMDEDTLRRLDQGQRSEKRNLTFSPPPNNKAVAQKNDKKESKEVEIKAKKDVDNGTPAFGNSIVKGGQAFEEQKIIGSKDLKVIKEETIDKANQWRFTKLVHRERRPGADLESRIKIIKKDDGPGLYYQGWANQKKPKGDYPFDNGLKCNIF